VTMIHNQLPDHQDSASVNLWPGRKFPVFWLVGLGLLTIALRLPYIGHVVSWDEAWNLCALKSLAGGGGVDFTLQFWRHPPTYLLMGRLLEPLRPGLDSRMQLLSLALNTAALLAFVVMVSRLFGRQIALYTGLAYAMMPGALFFDTWIKHDPVATLFGVLSLWAYYRRKNWLAGFMLGLAFLGKETAAFYAIPFSLLPFLLPYREKKLAGVCLIYGIAFGVSCWWYLQMAAATGNFLAMFSGSSVEASKFIEPWWFYLARLRMDLGLTGLILFVAGLAVLFRKSVHRQQPRWRQLLRPRLMPLIIIGPVYFILALSKAKPGWMTVGIYPLLALLIGYGWLLLTNKLILSVRGLRLPLGLKRLPGLLITAPLLILIMGIPLLDFRGKVGYQALLNEFSPLSLKTMQPAYTMAEALNSMAKGGEKLVLMPMLYRGGPSMPDPIFFWQLKVPLDIIRINNSVKLDYQTLTTMLIQEKADWLLMSPLKGSDQGKIYQEFYDAENQLQGYTLPYTVLLKVAPLWRGK